MEARACVLALSEKDGPPVRRVKQLAMLLADVARKVGALILRRWDLVEVRILGLGLGLAGMLGLFLFYVLLTDPPLHATLSSTAVLHLMGGRALGVMTCLSSGLPIAATIAYNFFIEVVIVLVAYGVFVLVMRNVIEPKLLKATVRQAELTAQSQRTRVKRYGAVGLFLFVMFPFMMTGPVVGAIIGYLLHYKPAGTFSIVFGGTLTSLVVYALMGRRMLEIVNRHVDLEQLRLWGGLALVILVVVFVVYHVGTVKRILESSRDGRDASDR